MLNYDLIVIGFGKAVNSDAKMNAAGKESCCHRAVK